MDSYVEAFTPGWSQAGWAQYDYDPDAARTALAELCAKPDIDCTTNPPTVVFTAQSADLRIRLSEILEPMFTDVGIAFRAELDPALVFFGSTLDFGRYDLGGYSWKGSPGLAPLVRIHGAWDPGATPPLGLSFGRWGSREVIGQEEAGYNQGPSSVIDDNTRRYEILVSQMKFTADATELRAYFEEAEQILADQIVFIPLFQTPDAGVVWADEIGGYRHNTTEAGDLWNVGSWYRADA
jgi:ABC-type transport system substrate-binding protein